MGTIIGEGITFDDVLLVPQYSEVTPNLIDLKTHLTKKIVLNIPMMSAAMDTVLCNVCYRPKHLLCTITILMMIAK